MNIIGQINFPEFTGIKCNMMPYIQGESSSLPEEYQPYAKIVEDYFLEKNEIGFLTIDEAFVEAGQSQRGYNSKGIERNVHVEVGRYKEVYRWGGGWRGSPQTLLHEDTKVLIANSISNTCRTWDVEDKSYTEDGDLSEYLERYPEDTGRLLKAGEMAKIGIFTPHECIPQNESGPRQFFRIVGQGVTGREEYFTLNPLVEV